MLTNPRSDAESKAYKEKIGSAVLEAIIKNSIVEHDGQRTAAVISADVVDVMLLTIAMMLGGSDACSSPTKIREVVDRMARRLRPLIAEARVAGGVEHMEIPVVN